GINIGIFKRIVFTKTFNTLSTLILIFIVFIIITLYLLYSHTKRTIKPLEILTIGASALGEGDLSTRMDVKANNEIGSLAESFNHMAEQLQQEHLKLSSYMDELERQNEKLQFAHQEILQREQKLKDAQTQIILSEKMASLGVLIAGIAHEINTPVGAIANVTSDIRGRIKTILNSLINIHNMSQEELIQFRSFLKEFTITEYVVEGRLQWKKSRELRQWLADTGVEIEQDLVAILAKFNLFDRDKLIQYQSFIAQPWALNLLDSLGTVNIGMEICESSIKKINEIVKALKYYAYTDMDKTSLLDINENIENVLLLMRNKLKYHIEVEKDLHPLSRIHCTSEISQVWTNLISNAYDAITESKKPDEKGRIRIKTREEKDWISVQVTDDGIGIPKENESKMFDPFFTTKEIGKGTGLGLSIVTGIINKHNGRILVDSIPGKTTFTILLPKDSTNGGVKIG
ncbi:MAG: HAMP domain-containing protein, partial [Candidatus Tectomicrobia bacterium]|nr:HAMP domain-containing protein [Candidatus Tectomicrobia bacterium]